MPTPDVITRLVDATNRGDTDAFVAAFADDAHVTDFGREFHGHDGVRSWDSTDNIGVGMHFDVVEVLPEGRDAWNVVIDATSRRFNGRGGLHVKLRDGLVSELTTS